MTDDDDNDNDDNIRSPEEACNPRVVRERLESALEDARELARGREAALRRGLAAGRAWGHPSSRTSRIQWAAAIAEVEMLEQLLTRPAIAAAAAAADGDGGIPPLRKR